MMRRALVVFAILSAGCGKTVTDEDCRKIGEHMITVWQSESAKAASPDGADSDRAKNVIKGEGDKLVGEWSSECKKELMGRRVDTKEIDCLLGAKSFEQVNKCAEP
jgi:hypothetical protein